MEHRHLNHQDFTPVAIDDIIERGQMRDWLELRETALTDEAILRQILKLCRAREADSYAQRHHFWRRYAEYHLSPEGSGPAGWPGALPSHAEILAIVKDALHWQARPSLAPLDGIETGVRQLVRNEPLETAMVEHRGQRIAVPTMEEVLRLTAELILKRNAAKDYRDIAALAEGLGEGRAFTALESFDRLYPQPSGESALQQLCAQLAHPLPHDWEEARSSGERVKESCRAWSIRLFDGIAKDTNT